jgi:hypothetical protein
MPPKRIEKLLWFLLPPSCREHVLGDLQEKCKSPQEYTRVGLSVLAPVIVSRIRRVTDYQLLLMQAFAIYIAFVAGAWYLSETAFLHNHSGLIRLAVPTAVAVVALLISNAYFDPVPESVTKPILQSAISIALAFLGQTAIFDTRPALAVPFSVMLFGSCASILLVPTLQILFPPVSTRTKAARLGKLHRPQRRSLVSPKVLLYRFRTTSWVYHSRGSKIVLACAFLLLALVLLGASIWQSGVFKP